MEYNDYGFLFPPRPETKIPQTSLGFYERRGWVAQVKKNGTNCVVYCKGDTVIFKQRHQTEDGKGLDHRDWTPKAWHTDFFRGMSDKWNVFHAELIHSKTQSIKDHLFIHDILVSEGVHLVGSTLLDRHKLLHEKLMTVDAKEEDDLYRLGVGFSIARNLTHGFASVFKKLKPEDEGLVLKNPAARLEPCFTETANRKWQVKSRIPHKNYGF